MEALTLDILKIAVPIIAGVLGWLWKKFLDMSEKIAVMDNTMGSCRKDMAEDLASLKEKINTERDNIHKTIEKIQQRQDSHSRKQDDTQKMITELDVKMVTKFGDIAKELSSIVSDVRNINRVFQVYDEKIMLRKDN